MNYKSFINTALLLIIIIFLLINFNETKKINLYLSEELSFWKELLADLDHDIHEIENFINKDED